MKITLRLLPILALGITAFAQSSGTLTGTVQDPAGAAIPAADVQLFLAGGSTPIYKTKTTGEGLFRLTGIRPETYEVRVEAAGFSRYITPNVVVDPARETSLPAFKLEIGSTTTAVEVRTESENVQTTNVEISNTVSMQQVAKLPVVNRNPLSLIGTQAGVLTTGPDNSTINGQRTSFSNVTLNGVNIQDNFLRTNALDFVPNLLLLGQVSEFTVSTSNIDASQSGASAVTFLAPSGSNTYHGSVYWSNRNNVFAANTWFNNQSGVKRPFLNQNQLGGVFAGHIIKDKWFFYMNYEAFRLRQTSAYNPTILTADARNGIFTYRDTSGTVQKVNVLTLAGTGINPAIAPILAQVPTADKINNFLTGDSSAALLRNTAGYSYLLRNNRTRDNVIGTTDYILSTKNVFNATFSWNRDILDRTDSTIQNDYSLVPKVANDDTVNLFAASWRFVPTATLTNELRGGFNFAPAVFATNQAFPSAIITGFVFNNPLNTFRGQGRSTNTYNLNDNASWVKGKHFVKFGFSFQSILTAPYNDAGITPTYTIGLGTGHQGLVAGQFPGGISSSDVSAANNLLASLAGDLSSYTQTFNVNSTTSGYVNGATSLRHFILNDYAFYVQDNWRIAKNLTLELGLRYEYFTPLRERDNLEIALQPAGTIANTLLSPNGTLNFVHGGFYNPDKKNFGPRIGFAWDPQGNGKTSIRGGYGIYYVNDEIITTVRNNIETNSGLQATSTNSGLTSFANSPTPVIIPAFKIPRTDADNYALNSSNAIGYTNPNLRTPYLQSYSLSVQHDFFNGTILDIRYVGNHGTKLLRGTDLNQVNITGAGFLADFRRAQSNGVLAQAATGRFTPTYNAAIPGSQPLTVFPTLPSGGLLTNSTVLTDIQQGEVGTLAQLYQTNGLNGNINFFPNPNALGANYISNGADSSYNSLQVDVRHRTSRGLTLQANYTYSKVLSNSSGDTQTNFEPLLDNATPQAERAPAPFDLRHVFKANGVYDIPVGTGHRFNPKYMGRIIGGWSMGSILVWESGNPFSILSARGTLNRGARSAQNTANALLNGDALFNLVAFRMTGNGPYFIAPSAIGPDGRGVSADGTAPFQGQAFANPGAGTLGTLQRRVFNGPREFNQDFSLLKQVRITERQNVQLRMDATNIWNHPTFYVPDPSTATNGSVNVNNTTFGKITSTFFGRRLIQLSLYYNF